MDRLCVFAHWDRDNIIDDYVIYYLNALKEVCRQIIFVSDCDLEESETEKLNGIADFILAKKHEEYDFGSYKRGFLLAKEKGLEFDELVFVNDSCYGPFYSLVPIFEKMAKKKCDFWGLTQNRFGIKYQNDIQVATKDAHLQSYFLVFSKNVFDSEAFLEFISSVKQENSKELVVINYEIKLTKQFSKRNYGYRHNSFINCYKHVENCTLNRWKELIVKHDFPFLKTSIPKFGSPIWGEVKDWDKFIPQSYPIDLIYSNVKRVGKPYERAFDKMDTKDRILMLIFKTCPYEIYLFSKFFDRKVLSTFRRLFRYVFKNF